MKTNDNAVQQNSTTPFRTKIHDFGAKTTQKCPQPITLFLN